MRRLLKLKYKEKDHSIFVKFDKPNPKTGCEDIYTFESNEAPRKELKERLQAMVDHALSICELAVSYRESMKVSGVTCTYTNDVQGLVITSLRELEGSNSPMVLNTPHFTREPYNEDQEDDMNIFSMQCGMDLDELEKEVFAYIDGKRQQKELDFSEEEEGEEEPDVLAFPRDESSEEKVLTL